MTRWQVSGEPPYLCLRIDSSLLDPVATKSLHCALVTALKASTVPYSCSKSPHCIPIAACCIFLVKFPTSWFFFFFSARLFPLNPSFSVTLLALSQAHPWLGLGLQAVSPHPFLLLQLKELLHASDSLFLLLALRGARRHKLGAKTRSPRRIEKGSWGVGTPLQPLHGNSYKSQSTLWENEEPLVSPCLWREMGEDFCSRGSIREGERQ